MLHFIIVEDDEKQRSTLKDIINGVMFETNECFKIESFAKYDSKLETIIKDNSEVKIYILDIELENSISGLQIAKKIRKVNLEDEIIFITNHDRMFEEVYRTIYKVYAFIEKFNNFKPRLISTLKSLIDGKFDNKTFKYKARNVDLDLHIKNILFVYRDTYERKCVIKMAKNSYMISMSLKELESKLGPKFKRISRSCLVNTDLVEAYDYLNGYVILSNGEKVEYLSKAYRDKDDDYTENL